MQDVRVELQEWPHWHIEKCGAGRVIAHKLKGPWLFEGSEICRTEGGSFEQLVQIGEFEDFGRGLVIDGMSQLAETVEPVYTTALIFPAALSADSRRSWFIAGGGDGPAAREALRFLRTERVVLADLSRTVVRETQRLIPSFWDGCQNDPRLTIVNRDVFAVMRELVANGEKFDIVISDLTDPEDPEYTPFAESTVDHIYTEEGLRLFAGILAPDGVFAMQAQELSEFRWQGHSRLKRMLRKIYPCVYSYRVFIEFFGYWESFLIAFNDPRLRWVDWDIVVKRERGIERIENFLLDHYRGVLGNYYDSDFHAALAGSIPPALRAAVKRIAP